MDGLNSRIKSLDQLFGNGDLDYVALRHEKVDAQWLATHSNRRIVNSFLFNYTKIQDKMGNKLFLAFLAAIRELETPDITMIDILRKLEKFGIINDIAEWDQLREIRNAIAHEYPDSTNERLENIRLALSGYDKLKVIYASLKDFARMKGINVSP